MTSGGVFPVFGGDRVIHHVSMRSPNSNLLAQFSRFLPSPPGCVKWVAGQSRPSVLWRRERSMAIPLSRLKPPKAGAEGQSLQGDGQRQQFLRQDREHAPSTPSSIRTALGSHRTPPHSSWRGARLLLSWPNGVFRLLRTSPRGSIRRFSSSPRWSAPACWPAPP